LLPGEGSPEITHAFDIVGRVEEEEWNSNDSAESVVNPGYAPVVTPAIPRPRAHIPPANVWKELKANMSEPNPALANM
jgi:hypothetical protein